MQVRIAEAGDYEQLLKLYRQLNPEDPVADDAVRRAFAAILQSPGHQLIVADLDGVLVGSCYLNIIPNMTRAGRPYAVIENVITDVSHRKRGIGKAVMAKAAEVAGAAGCYKIMLMTGRKDPAVMAFYESCGYARDAKQAFILRSET